tara:strand:+ start:256 stop:366 length:111 start_codon:yes stop_codon:yes gene_type:complete
MPIGMRRWHYKRLVKAKEEEKKAMKKNQAKLPRFKK